jgi:hypothetical protein
MGPSYLSQKEGKSRVQVAHACNPSYSGGRDQEDGGSKPTQANSSRDPILEKPFHKKIGLVEWLKVKALSSSPGTTKKKKKKRKRGREAGRKRLMGEEGAKLWL